MAIYEYFCPQCRKVFDVIRPMSKANGPANCPKCKSKGEKLLSVFASTAGKDAMTWGILKC
jgi:putative FmdB family regulatory protein